MQGIQELLGGRTRFAVIEALAEAGQPMTAYQIAMAKGLDPAATYRCLAEFSKLGVARPTVKARKQTSYALSSDAGKAAAKFLYSLKQKRAEQQSQVADLEEWTSPQMRAERTSKVVKLDRKVDGTVAGETRVAELVSKRVRGELAALITSSKIAFKELFAQEDERTFVLKEQ